MSKAMPIEFVMPPFRHCYALYIVDQFCLPIALKRKADVFGSVFDFSCIQELCNSRKLEFIHRVLIQPELIACVINGNRISWKAQDEMPKIQKAVSKQEESKELEGKIQDLNKQLRVKQIDNEKREIEAAKIKEMKQKRWNEFQSLHTLRRELKDARNTDVSAIHNAGQTKFSGLDYGLKTMSVTVKISPEVFSSHLNYYNKLHPENPLQRRTVELATIRTKDRAAAAERKFLKGDSNGTLLFMDIGNAGTGVSKAIRGYDRRGGKWLPKIHKRYAETMITDEHMTSQLCVYCYFLIARSRTLDESISLGTVHCLNPNCEAFKHGRATNNRDVMSATTIGISVMAQALLRKSFPPFSKQQ
ncbi:hypothetical protein G6F56_001712 [Rhizopus delemar]|nr:hypothetical protein G6F56_001712 [Rhizopus delemar]